MKRKHKDAMIAMGIKISALEHLFKMHGQAHMAQDLLPQFRALCEKVETHHLRLTLEGKAQQDQNRSISELRKRVEDLEKRMVQIDILRDRLNDHDESIESLTETVDQLSTCKCQAGEQMLKRITELEESNATFLKSIPDIEILKTQVAALEEKPSSKRLMDIETEIKDMREDYHAHFRGLRGDEIKTLIDRTEVL